MDRDQDLPPYLSFKEKYAFIAGYVLSTGIYKSSGDIRIPLNIMFWLPLANLISLCFAANGSDSNTNDTTQPTFCISSPCCGMPGIPGIPGIPGQAGSSGLPGARGPPGSKGGEGARGGKGDKGDAGRQGLSGPQGPQGLQGPAGSLSRSWKQCTFKSINDDRDTGLLRECIFKKMSNQTALQVYWDGNLRIVDCDLCCSRWYFTFNGAECSTPAAIDGTIYMERGKGNRIQNLHRPRHIEGVCEKIHDGMVRVGFWVGRCSGYPAVVNALTGWNSVSRIYVEEIPPPQA
ncbi:collagen triple helix repeat-containing protein 1-like isoform X2 [Montipora foliosa]|uniref:collagen triple helix repeat-containing protein 1-like isoform X2 n=2 Tax=Montipora foliosa TaxID=591990 RepID=UPI0035F1D17B